MNLNREQQQSIQAWFDGTPNSLGINRHSSVLVSGLAPEVRDGWTAVIDRERRRFQHLSLDWQLSSQLVVREAPPSMTLQSSWKRKRREIQNRGDLPQQAFLVRESRYPPGWTILHTAAATGDIAAVIELLYLGNPIDAVADGASPLFLAVGTARRVPRAARSPWLLVVKYFLKCGADPNTFDPNSGQVISS
jgi:hypothetical protein